MGFILGLLIGGFLLYLMCYGIGILLGLIGGSLNLISEGNWIGIVILVAVIALIVKVVF